MPVGASNGRQCLPISHSYIADALAAHQLYVDQMHQWYEWLEDNAEPEHALQLILFKLISDTIQRREQGGAWQNVDEDLIPTVDNLRAAIDSDKYNGFRLQIESLRKPIEDTAVALVHILNSPEFIAELDDLPYDEQLLYANMLADQLGGSNVGLFFQRSSINAPLQSPLPLFHPDRLLKQEGSFASTTFPVMRRASRNYADVFLKLSPLLLSDPDYTKFSNAALDFIAKYFPDDVIDALTLEEQIDNARQYLKTNPQYLDRYGKPTAAAIWIVFEVFNIYFALKKLRDDPGARTMFGLLRAIASLTTALSSTQSMLKLPKNFVLPNARLHTINFLTVIYDLSTSAIDAHYAWRTGDISVAAGQVLQGVGLAGAAAVASWQAASAAGALVPSLELNPAAGAMLSIGAYLVVFTGTLVIVYTQDPPFERWFKNNYFSKGWDNVTTDETPAEVFYKFKRVDGTPELARQISEYISMFYPIGLKVERGQLAPQSVVISIQPNLAYHESHIVVKRIIEHGDDSLHGYIGVPLYMNPINAVLDNVTASLPASPRDDEKLSDWIRTFSPLELSQGMNPNFDATGNYFEVEVTIPDKFEPALRSIVLGHPESELMSKFPFILRARARLE